MAQETDSAVARDEGKEERTTSRLAALRARAIRVIPWLAPTLIALALVIPAWLDARLAGLGRARSGLTVLGAAARDKSAQELSEAIARRAVELERRRLTVKLLDKRFELDPATFSMRIDAKASAERVLRAGADGGFVAKLAGYWKRRWATVDVPLAASVARPALEQALVGFEAVAI